MQRRLDAVATDRLPPLVTFGLFLLLVVGSVLFDPWGYSGYLAVKVAPAGVGLLLMVVSLRRHRTLVVPGWPWSVIGALLLGLMAISTAASPAVWRSLLGAPIRMEGLLAWLGYATAFLVGLSLWHGNPTAAARTLVRLAVIAVLIVGAVGVLEVAGVEIDSDIIPFMGRVRSTFGNPATLSGFLVLAGPLAALASKWSNGWRWGGRISVVLTLVTLAAAQTRSVLAAVGVWGVVVGLVRLRGRQKWIGTAAALLAIVVFSVGGRWQQVGDDLALRSAYWEVAVSVIADDPLLGSGPEMFIAGYGENVSDEIVREFGRSPIVDRAHNIVLDFAAAFGMPAGVVFIAILTGVGLLTLGAVRKGDWFQVAVGSGIGIYLLQQQVFFPNPTLDMVWWLMIGVLVANSDFPVLPAPRAVYVLMLCVAAALVVNAVSMIANDRLYIQTVNSARLQGVNPEWLSEAYEHVDTAVSRRPFDDLSYLLMGELLADASDPLIVTRGAEVIERGARYNPGHELVSFALSDVRLQAFRLTSDPSFASESAHDLSVLIAAQPANGDAYLKRGVAWYFLGDINAARVDWERAAFLMPDRPEPLQNLRAIGAAPQQ